jgi:hypothetical protein
MKPKLTAICGTYIEQLTTEEQAKILTNLRSPAPLISRIRHLILKGKIRPTTRCLPGS